MHRTLLVSFLAAAVFAARSGDQVSRARIAPRESHLALEQVRLRAHFDSVLDELRARDVSHLTANQRAARSELSTWLAEYRNAGVFPLNDRYSDSLTPVFRDASGATCAMAYLIERSGRRDIVDRVASTRNLAYVRELADDSALVAWIDSVGFDASEAARVQPAYGLEPPPREVSRKYAVTSAVLSGASLATATWNIVEPNRAVGLLGIITGGFTMVTGLIPLNPLNQSEAAADADRAFGAINLVAGGVAVIAGLVARGRQDSPTARTASGPRPRDVSWGIDLAPVPLAAFGAGSVRLAVVGRF